MKAYDGSGIVPPYVLERLKPIAVIRLPGYTTLPYRPNDRIHWAKKAKITREIRHAAYVAAKEAWGRKPPIDYPVVVTLVWQVVDKRVRDAGAGAMTQKAAIDGMVDARLLSKDDSSIVFEERQRVELGPVAGIRLEVHHATDPQKRPTRGAGRTKRPRRGVGTPPDGSGAHNGSDGGAA